MTQPHVDVTVRPGVFTWQVWRVPERHEWEAGRREQAGAGVADDGSGLYGRLAKPYPVPADSVMIMRGHVGEVLTVAVSSDRVVSGGSDGSVRVSCRLHATWRV